MQGHRGDVLVVGVEVGLDEGNGHGGAALGPEARDDEAPSMREVHDGVLRGGDLDDGPRRETEIPHVPAGDASVVADVERVEDGVVGEVRAVEAEDSGALCLMIMMMMR